MKKIFLVLLSVLTVLAFATASFALHQVKATEYTAGKVSAAKSSIELGGQLRIRGEVKNNTSDFNDETSDAAQGYDERARLSLKATVSPNTMGFVELETGADNDSDTWTWGNPSSAGTSGTKRGTLSLRQAYIAHQGNLMGNVSGFKAGHMLLSLGNALFYDHTKFGDDAFILWTSIGGGEVSLIDIKLSENGATTTNDDTDAIVLAAEMPMGGVNVSGDVTYLRGHDKSTYDKGTKFYNFGLRASADVAGLKVKGDVELQTGKDKTDASDNENSYSGRAFMLGAEAKVGAASVRFNGAYGSGDKIDDANDSGDKNEGFRNFLSDQQNYTYVYEYKVPGASGAKHTGLTNTWYLNLGATASVNPDVKVSGDLYYLRAVKSIDNVTADMDSKDVGVELDGKVEYQIDTNLTYFVEAGYLWAGDFYANVTGDVDNIDNPYSVRHGIILSF